MESSVHGKWRETKVANELANRGWDLVANFAGCPAAVSIIWIRQKKRMEKPEHLCAAPGLPE